LNRILLFSFAAATAVCFGQAKTVIDNDQVKVLNVVAQPHQKTRTHDHKVNRVMIYLTEGTQDITYTDGRKTTTSWRANEAKWSPASGMHVAEITSNKPVTIVEVELKRPAPASAKPTGPMDPVKLDPKHYKVEFENPQVRVLNVLIGGKEPVPMHEHTRDRVVVYVTDMDFLITSADGKATPAMHQAGDVGFSTLAKHKEDNRSDKAARLIVVELK
jgi:quercetin dioxygenase-like cupin family protein